MAIDQYNSIKKLAKAEYKDRGSRFIARLFPCSSLQAFADGMQKIKEEFPDARHFCYAYRMNPNKEEYRVNDDGEPGGSAGLPIYNQIQSAELWDVCCVVVRYFGGTKLGVSGLIKAYKIATAQAVEASSIVEKRVLKPLELSFEYSSTSDVLRMIQGLDVEITDEKHDVKHHMILGVPLSQYDAIKEQLENYHLIDLKNEL